MFEIFQVVNPKLAELVGQGGGGGRFGGGGGRYGGEQQKCLYSIKYGGEH